MRSHDGHMISPFIVQDDTDFSDISGHATPTQQQQMTALVILGMIGAEFNSESKNITPQITKKSSKRKVESMPPGKYDVGSSL